MKVRISAISRPTDVLVPLVKFSTGFGQGLGQWMGELPIVGEEYEVEIELEDEFTWGNNAVASEFNSPLIDIDNNQLRIRGTLEISEPDGYNAIRLGNSLVVFEARGNRPELGTTVNVTTKKAYLYDTQT